jgi:hypothetical protein
MKTISAVKVLSVFLVFATGACSDSLTTSSDDVSSKALAYPAYVDSDGDRVNDYVEAHRHEGSGHVFTDGNGDGVCDYAQNGSPAWHGPGFIDEDGNGLCDYWQEGSARLNQHEGLRYRDGNRNGANDYHERSGHLGDGHPFTDGNSDGICDLAQDGGPAWHGPGFIDEDGSGMCDRWEGDDHSPHRGPR